MSDKDYTKAQRQAAHSARLLAEGGRRLTVRVPAEINAKLEAEMQRTGESANAIVLRLLNTLHD